jgi:hypothetical protein
MAGIAGMAGNLWQEATMDSEATRKARIAVLHQEIELIHHANRLYWRQVNPGDAAKAGYYRRQERLEELRSELAELHD